MHKNATEKLLKSLDYGKKCGSIKRDYIIQKYIENPLLIYNKKFDFRVYMLIANMNPLVVLYHDGFLRVTLNNYNITSNDPSKHITNTAMAKEFIKKNQQLTDIDKENAFEEQM